MAAEACGGSEADAIPAACAVEMVHTYSLIHDDLPAMDNDDLRHGKPSCHKAFGEALAILAGDGLLTHAFAALAAAPDAEVARRLAAELADAAGPAGMVGGQAADLRAEREQSRDETLLRAIHRRKTARMTEAAAVMGAVAARAGQHHERSLREYGEHLGLAFQIADDILDAEATTDVLGKTAGKDAAAGKLTYVKCYGLDAARQRARAEADRAVDALRVFGHEADYLRDLARFVVERSR
jgi:geranylgeranyl pyrophosphate synthase